MLQTKRFLWVLAVVCLAPALRADDIVLKNGRMLSGRILESDSKKIVLSVDRGSITLRREDIASITKIREIPNARVPASTSPVIADLAKKWNPNKSVSRPTPTPSTRRVAIRTNEKSGMAAIRKNNSKAASKYRHRR